MRLQSVIVAVLLAAFVLSACNGQTDQAKNITDSSGAVDSGADETFEGPILEIVYAGGFVPVDRASTRFVVHQNGTAVLSTTGPNQTLTTLSSKSLTPSQLEDLQALTRQVSALDAEYGRELRDQVADAGFAAITIRNGRGTYNTTVDPNIDEAYPPVLQGVREWISGVMQEWDDGATHECLSRPESCYEVYDPVCGNGNKTYSNDCVACREGADTYVKGGACEGGEPSPDAGNESLGGKKQAVDCTDPRPDACTKEYLPVCGQKTDSTTATYGNKCTACSDRNVTSYYAGVCEQETAGSGDNAGSIDQPPSGMPSRDGTTAPRLAFTECRGPRPTACTMDYNPVCGADGQTYGNGCGACAAGVEGYWPSACEDQPRY